MFLTSEIFDGELIDMFFDCWPVFLFSFAVLFVDIFFSLFLPYVFSCDKKDYEKKEVVMRDELQNWISYKDFNDFPQDGILELSRELRKNDEIKLHTVSQSFDMMRHIPLKCPYCYGVPDDSGICQYCGSRLI